MIKITKTTIIKKINRNNWIKLIHDETHRTAFQSLNGGYLIFRSQGHDKYFVTYF